MKKIMICCFAVMFLALPMVASACGGNNEPACPTPTVSVNSVSDVKGYGEQTASFNVGVFDVDSRTTTTTTGKTGEWSVYGNVAGDVAPCTGVSCGMIQSKGNFDFANYQSENTTTMKGPLAQGGIEMTTMGGLAICVTANDIGTVAPASGSLNQTQTASYNYSVNLTTPSGLGNVNGGTAYTGTQTLNLKVGTP